MPPARPPKCVFPQEMARRSCPVVGLATLPFLVWVRPPHCSFMTGSGTMRMEISAETDAAPADGCAHDRRPHGSFVGQVPRRAARAQWSPPRRSGRRSSRKRRLRSGRVSPARRASPRSRSRGRSAPARTRVAPASAMAGCRGRTCPATRAATGEAIDHLADPPTRAKSRLVDRLERIYLVLAVCLDLDHPLTCGDHAPHPKVSSFPGRDSYQPVTTYGE